MSSKMKAQVKVERTLVVLMMFVSTGCLVPEIGQVQEVPVGTPTETEADFSFSTPPSTPAPNPGGGDTGGSTGTVPTPPPQDPNAFNFDLIINDDKGVTKLDVWDLLFIAPPWFAEYKISTNDNCSGGAWQPWQDNTQWNNVVPNATNVISVQYRDYDQALSPCIVKRARHDNKGPEIVISKYPTTNIEEGSTTELTYTVTDASVVTSVACTLGSTSSVTKSCASGTQNVSITAMPAGGYRFSIEATDELGNKNWASVAWQVVNSTRQMSQTITIKDDRKVDILFVIDNSGSMQYEQQSMASRVSKMLKVLEGLNWQIAVTTTDPTAESSRNPTLPGTATRGSGSVDLTDGRLIPIYGSNGQYILDSTTPLDTAQYRLGMTLQRPETGSGLEQGIYTTYRFIERSQSTNPSYRNFFRDGANFAVVVISDEDESANGTKNDPKNLADLVSKTFNQQKVFTWHSIITKPGDSNCRNTYGATYGDRYKAISDLTGGLIGSVCETDYAAQLVGIANGIRNMNMSLGLACQPLSQFPIVIKRDGVTVTDSYTLEGLNLKFASILAVGNYTVEYRCLK